MDPLLIDLAKELLGGLAGGALLVGFVLLLNKFMPRGPYG